MLAQHPERGAQILELLSQVTGHELRGEGRVYGGGLQKIEPSELVRVCATALVSAGRSYHEVSARENA